MSKLFAKFILKYRLPILIVITGFTLFMGFYASKVEITYNFARLLPDSDSASIDYDYFKSKFGQDGNVLVIGIDKDKINKLKNYQEWARLGNRIKLAPGRTVLEVEKKYLKTIPKVYLKTAHHLLILHGRYTCIARKPRCTQCCI